MDSARLFRATVVITAAIISGVYLLDRAYRAGQPLPPEQTTWTTLEPGGDSATRHPGQREARDPGSIGNYAGASENVSAETSADGIIICQHPDHGTVYTNAANCDEVDYDNRLTQAEPFQPIPNPDRYRDSDYQSPERAAANSRSNNKLTNQKPNLRLHGKSPPKGLNVSCKNSVGKALEIERDLAATNNPRESAWRDSYCKQRCEAIEESCPVKDSYFYYRFRSLCPDPEYRHCWYQVAY